MTIHIKKDKKNLMAGCVVLAVLILVIVLVAGGISRFTGMDKKTAEGLKIIKQAESADVTAIESKIQKLEEKEKEQNDLTISLKEAFASTVVMGDSITEGFYHYGILNASSVVSKIGVELDELDEEIEKVKELNPQVIFLSYGLNDILATRGDTGSFIDEYKTMIEKVQKELPDTKIFVNSIFPVKAEKAQEVPEYQKVDEYNTALRELCDKKQIAFVDNTALVHDEDYEEDGIHFKADFYPVWAEHMAEVAGL